MSSLRKPVRLVAVTVAGLALGGALAYGYRAPNLRVAAVATAPNDAAPAVPWLADANPLYEDMMRAPAALRVPFGRVRLSVTATSATASCPAQSVPCSVQEHLYVRAQRGPEGVRLLPQCSALNENTAALGLLKDGPLQLEVSELGSGHAVESHASPAVMAHIDVESWTDPPPLPPEALSAWAYTRSLVVAHAKSFGVDLGKPPRGCAFRSYEDPYRGDTCEATQGSTVALLSAPDALTPRNGQPLGWPLSAEDWIELRVRAPVDPGAWSRFCGRLDVEQRGVTCHQLRTRMGSIIHALTSQGVDIARFSVGAIITNGTLYYPQVSVRHLARIIDCLGLHDRVAPALAAMAGVPSLDWENRFRVACLSAQLDGGACDRALFQRISGIEPGTLDDDADARCIDGLTGEANLGCTQG